MTSVPEPIRTVSPNIEHAAEKSSTPLGLARQALAARDDVKRASKAHDQASSEADRHEEECGRHGQRTEHLEELAIRRVLESCGAGEVDIDDWHHPLRPVAAMREGDALLIVVPSPEKRWPSGTLGADLAPSCMLIVVDDPRENEPSALDTGPTRVTGAADAVLRGVVVRCIGWWESARTAAMDAKAVLDTDDDEDVLAMVDARHAAERAAREAESLLENAILHYTLGRPATLANTEFHLEALRPAAVTHAGITYVVVADPTEALNDDHGPGMVTPIVARVEPARTRNLD